MYSSIAELDEIVKDRSRLIEDFKVEIPSDAPSADSLRATLKTYAQADSIDEVVEYYSTVRNGEIPDRLPASIMKDSDTGIKDGMTGQLLHQYLQQVGVYSKITKYMARGLRSMTPTGSVFLDPMTGNGLMVKALREAGVMAFGTDNNTWSTANSFEPIDALDSLKRYGDKITHLLISWASPESETDFEILQEVRKNYEHIQIIVIGEVHGCTGSAKFWDEAMIYDDLECYETIKYLYDRLYFIA